MGAVFGGLLGAGYWFFSPTFLWAVVSAAVVALIVGFLSYQFGDRFWEGLSRFGHWM